MSTEGEIVHAYAVDKMSVEEIAESEGVSRETIYVILRRHGHRRKGRCPAPAKQPRAKKTTTGHGFSVRESAGVHARFKPFKPHPEGIWEMPLTHPAARDGHTLFPKSVVAPMDSPRMLVEGKNNAKTGGMVRKGPWSGMPIFTLTLEERKTCPRACNNWQTCYGNGMHMARRHDALHEDFIAALAAETITLARQHPAGLVVRLHVLGDFFSPAYVKVWRHLMEMLPSLHVFGYTGRRLDDPESAAIAAEIETLNADFPDRWVIRTSHTEFGPMRSVVLKGGPALPADVIVCPAQTEATTACSTCGLCWLPAAKNKTIAFLQHGPQHGVKPKEET